MFRKRTGNGFRQRSNKQERAHLLKEQDKLLKEMMGITYIIACPRLYKAFRFYDSQKDEFFEASDNTVKLLNNQEFKWHFNCYGIRKSRTDSRYLDSWCVNFIDPVKFPNVTKQVWEATCSAIDDETDTDEFVAEGWIITLGDEPSDELAYKIFDTYLEVFEHEKANWESAPQR